MAMSDPSACWISMLSSGPMNCRDPSRWLWKVTPSSLIFRIPASENTWNPPLSVRIGPFHPMNLCSPPASSTSFSPGRRCRWYVLLRRIFVPISSISRGVMAFTQADVPTGM